MSRLTRDKIGKMLEAHNIGDFSALTSKKNQTLSSKKTSVEKNFKYDTSVRERELPIPNTSLITPFTNEKPHKSSEKQNNLNKAGNNEISVSSPLATQLGINVLKEKNVDPPVKKLAAVNWASHIEGKEFELIMHLINLCEKDHCLKTQPVFSKDLIELFSVTPTHLRNIILRLAKKKLLKIILHKSGKHALRVFEFENDVYSSLVDRKKKNN